MPYIRKWMRKRNTKLDQVFLGRFLGLSMYLNHSVMIFSISQNSESKSSPSPSLFRLFHRASAFADSCLFFNYAGNSKLLGLGIPLNYFQE